MSAGKFVEIGELIQTRLQEWSGLRAAPVILDRQHDVETEVAEAMAKQQGLAITIFFEGFSNDNLEADKLAPSLRYTVRIFGLPIINDEDDTLVPADVACIEVGKALHGWLPEGDARDLWGRLEIGRADTEPDAAYLIYALPATLKRVIL